MLPSLGTASLSGPWAHAYIVWLHCTIWWTLSPCHLSSQLHRTLHTVVSVASYHFPNSILLLTLESSHPLLFSSSLPCMIVHIFTDHFWEAFLQEHRRWPTGWCLMRSSLPTSHLDYTPSPLWCAQFQLPHIPLNCALPTSMAILSIQIHICNQYSLSVSGIKPHKQEPYGLQ